MPTPSDEVNARPADAVSGENGETPAPPNPPRPRPLDVLFGESTITQTPTYVVEPPRPASVVSPPISAAPEGGAIPQGRFAVRESSLQPALEPPASQSVARPSVSPSVMSSKDNQQFAAYLSNAIRQLYDDVATQLSDSPTVAEFCLGLLMQAREAYQNGDYALAEFYVESVVAKMKRSAKSIKASSSPVIWLLWLWQLLMLAVGGALIGMTYIQNLTWFGLPVAADVIVLMRAVGWGCIGGVIGAIYHMPWFVQFREYDPAYNMNYFARPLQGLFIGAVLFLISQAFLDGKLAALRGDSGEAPAGPVLLYVVAAFSGFGQQYVWEFFDGILKAIFRSPQIPGGLKPPRPPKDK